MDCKIPFAHCTITVLLIIYMHLQHLFFDDTVYGSKHKQLEKSNEVMMGKLRKNETRRLRYVFLFATSFVPIEKGKKHLQLNL
jgi:hypothetical protein